MLPWYLKENRRTHRFIVSRINKRLAAYIILYSLYIQKRYAPVWSHYIGLKVTIILDIIDAVIKFEYLQEQYRRLVIFLYLFYCLI